MQCAASVGGQSFVLRAIAGREQHLTFPRILITQASFLASPACLLSKQGGIRSAGRARSSAVTVKAQITVRHKDQSASVSLCFLSEGCPSSTPLLSGPGGG